jgi:predicted transcriptional regulator
MTDNEIRRKLLEHAFLHRSEHTLGIVSRNDIKEFVSINSNRIFQNMKIIKDEGYVKIENDSWEIYRLTSEGVRLVENRNRFESVFPINIDIPNYSQTKMDELEVLLSEGFPDPLRQIQKSKYLLFEHRPPDIENSIKDAVGSLEGLARIILNKPKDTLSEMMPQLKNILGHPAMDKILISVYAVRGDVPGVAHGMHESTNLSIIDAEFVFNITSSCIIYLSKKVAE